MIKKIMVVDDSPFMRMIIKDILRDINKAYKVVVARNGEDALKKLEREKVDLITLDIEMPKLNGIDTLKEIKRKKINIPVIMLSSLSKEGSQITMEALALGAEDFIEKPGNNKENIAILKEELQLKINGINNEQKRRTKEKIEPKKQTYSYPKKTIQSVQKKNIDAVVIASSTGGPKALFKIVPLLSDRINQPIFIVQHMPEGFTESFAQRLDASTKLKVSQAYNGQKIMPGNIYVAPGGKHMEIVNDSISLNDKPKLYSVRPSADYLFNTAADKYGSRLLGVVLTGMGRDGEGGVKTIKEKNGYNIVQSEESCVVFGMPGAALRTNCVDEIVGLEKIAKRINEITVG